MNERVKVKEEPKRASRDRKGDLHDALEDTFPASDPLSVTQPITSGRPAETAKPGRDKAR